MDESLHNASYNGDIAKVKYLISKNIDVNFKNVFGETPLLTAIRAGHKNIVECLITNGVNVDMDDQYGNTPLIIAIRKEHYDIAEILIANGCAVNMKCEFGDTPLLAAINACNKHIVDCLIKKGVDVNFENEHGHKPLFDAIEKGQYEIVEMLIANGADANSDKNGWTALHQASTFGKFNIAKYLIDNCSDVNAKTYWNATPLHCASEDGYKDIIELLIANGAEINVIEELNGNTPLHIVSLKSSQNFQWIKIYSKKFDYEYLFDKQSLIKSYEEKVHNYNEIIKLLIKMGADVNIKNSEGKTALSLATNYSHSELAMILKSYGALNEFGFLKKDIKKITNMKLIKNLSKKINHSQRIIIGIFAPLIVLVITLAIASEIGSSHRTSHPEFDWQNTWLIWVLFLLIVGYFEYQLFKTKNNK